MTLLILTICIAQGADAECRREVRLFDTLAECIPMRQPTLDLLATMETPRGVRVVFASAKCERGRDA